MCIRLNCLAIDLQGCPCLCVLRAWIVESPVHRFNKSVWDKDSAPLLEGQAKVNHLLPVLTLKKYIPKSNFIHSFCIGLKFLNNWFFEVLYVFFLCFHKVEALIHRKLTKISMYKTFVFYFIIYLCILCVTKCYTFVKSLYISIKVGWSFCTRESFHFKICSVIHKLCNLGEDRVGVDYRNNKIVVPFKKCFQE